MNYVKCINNKGYEASLREGKVYRQVFNEPSVSPDMIRVIDESYGEVGSEIGYLFAADRFEPIQLSSLKDQPDDSLTVHLPAAMKGILYAESILAHKSMSSLLRQWIEERLDFAEAAPVP